MSTELMTGHAYHVAGYDGVAFRFVRHPLALVQDESVLICEDDGCDHRLSEMCWLDSEPYEEENPGMAVMVMIGDDREHMVDVADVSPLSEEDFCRECGQTGCGHGK